MAWDWDTLLRGSFCLQSTPTPHFFADSFSASTAFRENGVQRQTHDMEFTRFYITDITFFELNKTPEMCCSSPSGWCRVRRNRLFRCCNAISCQRRWLVRRNDERCVCGNAIELGGGGDDVSNASSSFQRLTSLFMCAPVLGEYCVFNYIPFQAQFRQWKFSTCFAYT